MLVPESRKDDAYAIAKDAAQKVIAGDPKNDSTTIGPLVSDVQFKKVQNLIQKGIDEGAELLIGGTGKPDGLENGYYAKPTVFADVKNDMAISREARSLIGVLILAKCFLNSKVT